MLHLLDKSRSNRYPLDGYNNYSVKHILRYGDKELRFSIPKNRPYVDLLEEETYILNPTQEFVIKEVNPSDNCIDVVAKLNIEELEGKWWETFESKEATITDCLNLAFAGTGYIVGTCNITKKRTIRKDICSTWDIIKQVIKTYRIEIEIDTVNKKIDIYEQIGSDKGSFFMDSLNLKRLSVQSNSYDYCTKITALGALIEKDDGSKERISCTVTNNAYSDKIIEQIWKDERYTIVNDLKEDAQAKLDEIAKPYRAYSANVYKIGECNVGDTITLISKQEKIYDKFRIVTFTEYPDEKNTGKDEIEIANSILSFTDIQKDFEEASNTVDNITENNSTISEGAIPVKTFENIYARSVIADKIQGLEGDFGTLNATKANITQLDAQTARINSLEANSATVVDLQSATARIGILESGYGKISVLQSDVAEINTLIAGNVTSGSTQTIVLNANNTTIANALIKSAMIESINADKINAGSINTDNVTIKSSNGGIQIADNTMQFKDSNNKVRIQMGEDTQNNFNFIVRAEDGQSVLIDGTGVKENALADNLIKTRMLQDNSVKGSKIDWDDFFTTFNADGTHTLNSSKVKVNSNNQTLDVAFNQLTTTVNNISIGGTNIITNGGFTDGTNGYNNNGGRITVCDESGAISRKALKIVAAASNNGIWKCVWCKTGIMTISFYAKKDSSTNSMSIKFGIENKYSKNIVLTDTWTRYSITINASSGNMTIYSALAGTFYLHSIKVEEGNKVTDWSPSPQEVDDRISSCTTSISVANGKIETLVSTTDNLTTKSNNNATNITTLNTNYSTLKQTVDSISSTVSSHTSTISGLQTNVNNNSSSISQLSSKIDLKVETSTYTTDLQGIRADISSNNSSISILQDGIKTKVEATYVTNVINNITIGGTNLIDNSGFDNGLSNWRKNGTVDTIIKSDVTIPSGFYLQINSTGYANGLFRFGISSRSSKTTLSLYAKANSNIALTFGIEGVLAKKIVLTSEWVKYSFTITTAFSGKTLILYPASSGSYYIHSIKVEDGDKVTDWSPSPSEVKTYTNTKVSSVEQEVTASAICTKISNAVSGGTNSISTTYFTMDNAGLTIKNGGIKVLNSLNTQIFGVDTDGQLSIRGKLEQYNSNGRKSVEIKNNSLKLYDYKSTNDDFAGGLSNLNDLNSSSSGVALYARNGHRLAIGCSRNDGTTETVTQYISCVDQGDGSVDRRIDIGMETYFRGWGATFCNNDSTMKGFIKADAGAEKGLCIIGNNAIHLGYGSSSSSYAPGIDISASGITIWGNVTVAGTINGQKIGN